MRPVARGRPCGGIIQDELVGPDLLQGATGSWHACAVCGALDLLRNTIKQMDWVMWRMQSDVEHADKEGVGFAADDALSVLACGFCKRKS